MYKQYLSNTFSHRVFEVILPFGKIKEVINEDRQKNQRAKKRNKYDA